MGWSLLVKLAGEFFSRWLEKLNLKKQGASEQRLRDEKDNNEKIRKVLDTRNTPNNDRVRDTDFRD